MTTTQIKGGYKHEKQIWEDWLFTANPHRVLQVDGDWSEYVPVGELQREVGLETYACVSYATLSIFEMLIKKKYGIDRNYSDRWLARSSETNGGNSPKRVMKALQKYGVVDEVLYPWVSSIGKYYQGLPRDLLSIAAEFNKEWKVTYRIVNDDSESIREALKESPLGIAVTAWSERDGLYYKPKGSKDNHYTVLYNTKEDGTEMVFDSYFPFKKNVKSDTPHAVIYHYHIEKRVKRYWFLDLFMRLIGKI